MDPKTVEEYLAALQAVVDGAEGRSLTDEEVTQYETLETGLERARKSDEIQKRQAAYKTVATPALHTAASKGDDELDRAFTHYLRTGVPNADLTELRAQSEGAGSEGGFLVPETFRTKLIERMKAFGGVANVAETITTSTGSPMNWPTVDDTSNVGEIVAEGGTFASGADIVFGTANLGAYKYMAGGAGNVPLRVSVELLQDSGFDVQSYVSKALGTRIARIQATHLVSGTGVGQPQGIKTGLTGTASAAPTLVYNDLVGYIHSLDPAYREGSVWIFNDATLKAIRKILDTTNRPILKGVDEGMATAPGGETLLGYPVHIDQAFPDLAANSTTNWGVFGRISEGYLVRRVRDVQLIVNPWTRAANGQVEFTAWARMDAVQQNTNAYVALTAHA